MEKAWYVHSQNIQLTVGEVGGGMEQSSRRSIAGSRLLLKPLDYRLFFIKKLIWFLLGDEKLLHRHGEVETA